MRFLGMNGTECVKKKIEFIQMTCKVIFDLAHNTNMPTLFKEELLLSTDESRLASKYDPLDRTRVYINRIIDKFWLYLKRFSKPLKTTLNGFDIYVVGCLSCIV